MLKASSIPRLLVAVIATLLIVVACGGGGATSRPTTGASLAPESIVPPTRAASPGATAHESMGAESPGAQSPGAESPGTESPGAESPGAESPGATMGAMPSFENIGGRVSIIASWTGSEQDSFMAMLKPWQDATGVQVDYVGTRDMQTQLSNAISAGGTGLPDVAGVPGPGLARDWYAATLSDGSTALKPLDFLDLEAYKSSTPPGMAELGIADDGKLIGIFTKAAVKGLIWYNVNNYDGTVPATFDELENSDPAPAQALWCNAVESGEASGWPGTDWIEDIVIRQSGPDVYDSWVNGQTKWTSPEISQAFQTFGDVVSKSFGGGTQINATNFGDVGNGLFTDPPDCKFVHQASFISDFFVKQGGAEPTDFDFFVMPDINPQFAGALTGGGDMFGMFHDTPQAESLMQWLITPQAQAIWAARGGYIAANTGVPADVYQSASDRKAAEALQRASSFRFDGSDSMPGEMNAAFFKAIVDFVNDPSQIDSILQSLDQTQASAYSGAGASPGASSEPSAGASASP